MSWAYNYLNYRATQRRPEWAWDHECDKVAIMANYQSRVKEITN